MSDWTPTGRFAFRSEIPRGLFGRGSPRMILVIEERGVSTFWDGGGVDSEWVTRWRDATSIDLTGTLLDRLIATGFTNVQRFEGNGRAIARGCSWGEKECVCAPANRAGCEHSYEEME